MEIIIYMLMLGWIGLFLSLRRNGPAELHGHDVSIEIPLRVSSAVVARVLRMSRQRPLRKLLSSTPAYRELMHEYPQARVTPLPAA